VENRILFKNALKILQLGVIAEAIFFRADQIQLKIVSIRRNEPPRGKPRGIFQGILSILPQQAAGNSTLKEIKILLLDEDFHVKRKEKSTTM
jgi:hypothetical protein